MENKIQFNAAIYPKVMSIIIGNPYNKNENDSDEMVPELVVDLPRSAYLIYLQKIFDEHVEPEIDLFKKYAYGSGFGRFRLYDTFELYNDQHPEELEQIYK